MDHVSVYSENEITYIETVEGVADKIILPYRRGLVVEVLLPGRDAFIVCWDGVVLRTRNGNTTEISTPEGHGE